MINKQFQDKKDLSNSNQDIPPLIPLPQGDTIDVYGARVHNLKNIDVSIPHNSLSVITGLS